MIVLFDLNGTLTDLGGIGAPWAAPDLGAVALDDAIRTAMVDALTGAYRPFAEHLRAAIAVHVRRRDLDASRIDEALARAAALDPQPDAEEALTAIATAGHRLAVLTNSGAEGGRRTLRSAGLADHFETVLGVDAVRSFKPHPGTYRHAVDALGASPDSVILAAAHEWDVTGAKRAGLRGAWIDRRGDGPSPVAEAPDVYATSLTDLARQLAATPA